MPQNQGNFKNVSDWIHIGDAAAAVISQIIVTPAATCGGVRS